MRRRELLAAGAGLAVAATLGGCLPRAAAASGAQHVAVVGAGLAALTSAYRLKQTGYTATIYEASERTGGRSWTRRGEFAEGQIAEHGGEMIDQGHREIRQLAWKLGLELDSLLAAEVNGNDPFDYFEAAPYSYTQATEDLKQIWQQVHKDVSAAALAPVRREHQHGDRRLRCPRTPFLDLARRRLLESRFLGRQEHGDPTAGDGHQLEAARPVQPAVLGSARQSGRDLRRHRLPEHLGGDARPAGDRRHPGRLHGRNHRSELRQRHPG